MELNQGVYVYRSTQSTVRENVVSRSAQHLADVVNVNESKKVISGENFVSHTGLSICRTPCHLQYQGSGDHDHPFSNYLRVGVNLVLVSFLQILGDLFHHLCRRAMTVLSRVHYPTVWVLLALRWGRKHPVRTMDLCFGGSLIRRSA